jgi:hypothetical protein
MNKLAVSAVDIDVAVKIKSAAMHVAGYAVTRLE